VYWSAAGSSLLHLQGGNGLRASLNGTILNVPKWQQKGHVHSWFVGQLVGFASWMNPDLLYQGVV
jgi:hypothetical protein